MQKTLLVASSHSMGAPEILMPQKVRGRTPRTPQQALPLNLLRQEKLDMNMLVGPAGSSKTLLALAYGLSAILEEKRSSKLIVTRSTPLAT